MFQVIDMHCDTIPALQWKEKQEHLADADLQINLDKLEKGGSLCQCFTLSLYADRWGSKIYRNIDGRRCFQERTNAYLLYQ